MSNPTREQVAEVYHRPLLELVFQAAQVHREHHDPTKVQCSTLLSIKTGACPEDCAYCPQAARYQTGVERQALMQVEDVVEKARCAREGGADRFCMGAAWRDAKEGPEFDRLLEMVREVKALGLETCLTVGMLKDEQAAELKEAGLDYYNHNLDTSREHYEKIISTRTYDERLDTLRAVRKAGMSVCCGGIVGLGETDEDRIGLLHELANLDPYPESVPINALVRVDGTPLAEQAHVGWDVLVRTVAAARVLMPRARVRLSAGRTELTDEAQALCFLAGASSIFLGDRLLTTPNPGEDHDSALLTKLGLTQLRVERVTASV